MQPRTRIVVALGTIGAIAAVAIAWRASSSATREDERARASSSTIASTEGPLAASADARAMAALIEVDAGDARGARDAAGSTAIASARWGSGNGELGRERPQEGNAEGPMSLALAGREIVVLDQVNRGLVRFDRDGRPHAAGDAPETAQDVAVASNGTVAMLDRLAGKSVTLVDERGRTVGQLALPGALVGDPGMLTGVFVDGTTVYVEKEHGALVPIGTTDGRPLDDGPQLSGRPSRDGALLLTAVISSGAAGQVSLNAFDRKKNALRFARVYQLLRPTQAIVLLDTDARGTIYLGVAGGSAGEGMIACIDPGDGHALGRSGVPINTSAEESFRDFAVADDGTIVYVVRSDDGVEYRTARCP